MTENRKQADPGKSENASEDIYSTFEERLGRNAKARNKGPGYEPATSPTAIHGFKI